MFAHRSATAYAPASVGNVGIGFDILGHALSGAGDRVTVRLIAEPEVRISAIHGADRELPHAAAENTAGAALIAFRRRWTDSDVALYLDARLGSSEAISTAVELRGQAERADLAREVVVRDAAKALADRDPKRLRPRVLEPLHGLGPVAGAAVAWLSLIPLPPTPPAPPPPPGAEMVQIANLQGLDKIEALANLDPRDAAQKERLVYIARDA